MNRIAMPPVAALRSPQPRKLPKSSPARRGGWLIAASLMLVGCNPAGDAGPPPLADSAIGGDFTLIDKSGHSLRYADLAGKWRLLYFGYTFCPDVCPLDVQHMMQGYHAFVRAHPAMAPKMVPLFVSIDPQRDTPQAVGQFSAAFGPELVGLTGSPAQVASAAKAFAVFYEKRPGANSGSYLMDHSRAAYLMDPQGKPVALLPVDASGAAVATELAKWVH